MRSCLPTDGIHGIEKHEGDYLLDYDFNGTPAWKLTKDLVYDAAKKALVPRALGKDEEIDTKKLDDLKSAIDDLKIVDVERKPAAVPPDLRLRKEADVVGFAVFAGSRILPRADPDGVEGHFRIVSNKGDVALQLSDGACYVLRFGESTGQSSATDKTKDKKDAKKEAKKDEAAPGSNRYLFVMAEFNPGRHSQARLRGIAQGRKEAGRQRRPTRRSRATRKPTTRKPDAKEAKPAADAGKKDAAKKDEPKKEEKKIDLKAERERIEKDNKRKQEEYDEKVAAGKKHVKELNDRFADWYYVISDDVYRKIHLTRADFVKKKEAKDKAKDAAGHDHEHDMSTSTTVSTRCPPAPPPRWSS